MCDLLVNINFFNTFAKRFDKTDILLGHDIGKIVSVKIYFIAVKILVKKLLVHCCKN